MIGGPGARRPAHRIAPKDSFLMGNGPPPGCSLPSPKGPGLWPGPFFVLAPSFYLGMGVLESVPTLEVLRVAEKADIDSSWAESTAQNIRAIVRDQLGDYLA